MRCLCGVFQGNSESSAAIVVQVEDIDSQLQRLFGPNLTRGINAVHCWVESSRKYKTSNETNQFVRRMSARSMKSLLYMVKESITIVYMESHESQWYH